MEIIVKLILVSSCFIYVICAPTTLEEIKTNDVPKLFVNSVEASKLNQTNENLNIANNDVKSREVFDKTVETNELKEIAEKTKQLNERAKELNKKLSDYEKYHVVDAKISGDVKKVEENDNNKAQIDIDQFTSDSHADIIETTTKDDVYIVPLKNDGDKIKSKIEKSSESSQNTHEKKVVNFKSKESVVNSVEEDDSGNKVTNCKCKTRSSQTLGDEISDDISCTKPMYKVIYDIIKKNNATLQKYWIKILKQNNKILQRKKRESDVFKSFLHNFENNLDIQADDPFKSDETSPNKVDNVEIKGEKKLSDDTDVKYYHKKDNNVVKTKIDEKKDNANVHEENVFYHYSVENKNGEISTKAVEDIIDDNDNTINVGSTVGTTSTTSTTTTSTTTTTTSTTTTTTVPPSPSDDNVMNYDNKNFNDVNAMMNDNTFGNIGGNFGNVFKKMDENFENVENKLSNDFFGTKGKDEVVNIDENEADATDQSPRRRVIEIKL